MIMKKFLSALLAFSLLFCLFSCGGDKKIDDSGENPYAETILGETVKSFGFIGAAEVYASGDILIDAMRLDDDILSGKFGELLDYPELSVIDEYAVYFSNELYKEEFGLFRMTTEEEASAMKDYIAARMERLKRNAVNYPSVDTTMIDSYIVGSDGKWVWYAATNDNALFERIVKDTLYK